MAENIVINNTTPTPQSDKSSSGIIGLVRPIATLLLVISFIALIFGFILLVDNWEKVSVFFTTGFIGWLNPFDSPEGDTGPIDSITGKGSTSILQRVLPTPISWILGPLK